MNAVTGAFGYMGKYIARRLLMLGESVITLTGHPGRSNEFGASVEAFPFRFDDPAAMAGSLSGVRVLYNTYWVRFDHGKTTYDRAVANTCALIRAVEIAGVARAFRSFFLRQAALTYRDSGLENAAAHSG